MAEGPFSEQRADVGGVSLYLLRGGSGHPTLVLHGVEGHEGWLAFHQALAAHATVLAPSHPGYGHTDAPEWISTVQHQAVFYHWFLQQAGITSVDLGGCGAGDWIAAEMAVMNPGPLRNLVLVDAAGIRPQQTESLDIFITPWRQVLDAGFHNPAGAPEYQRLYGGELPEYGGVREAAKTMSVKMCYRPYMYNPSLPAMLRKVRTPTLVVWGDDDRILPAECGRAFQSAIPGAKLQTLAGCGHFAHLEQPQALTDVIRQWVAR